MYDIEIRSDFERDWNKENESVSEIRYKANFNVAALGLNGNGYAIVKRSLSDNIFINNQIYISIESLSIKNNLEKLGSTSSGVTYLGVVESKIKDFLREKLQNKIDGVNK